MGGCGGGLSGDVSPLFSPLIPPVVVGRKVGGSNAVCVLACACFHAWLPHPDPATRRRLA